MENRSSKRSLQQRAVTLGQCGRVAFPPERSSESHQPCCLLSDQPVNAEGKAGD